MAACSQSRLNSKSCPDSVRRYGNSSLNATMVLVRRNFAWCGRGTLRGLRGKQFPLKGIGFYATPQSVNGIDKFIDILKSLIHRRVTQIGHFIDRPEFFEHFGANRRRRNFAPAGFQLVHNLVHHILQGKKTGGTLFKSFRDAGGKFAPIKRFMCPVTLHHAQVRALDFFIGREAIFALQTFATTTDTGAVARLTGIDDFVITRPALGATHSVEALITTPYVVASMLL